MHASLTPSSHRNAKTSFSLPSHTCNSYTIYGANEHISWRQSVTISDSKKISKKTFIEFRKKNHKRKTFHRVRASFPLANLLCHLCYYANGANKSPGEELINKWRTIWRHSFVISLNGELLVNKMLIYHGVSGTFTITWTSIFSVWIT